MKFLILFGILFFLVLINPVFAQTIVAPNSGAKNVQYDLPYPGILPDSPLYFLKALRDNAINFFITDPLKKADYDLLMADKRLGASQMLLDKGEGDLSITTLSKAGNYFDNAISLAVQAKNQGENSDSILAKLLNASLKHQEIIYQMEQKAKGQTLYNLGLLEIRAKTFQEKVELIRSK